LIQEGIEMKTSTSFASACVAGVLLGGGAAAADLVVDAAGVASPYTTIEAAMVASSPGDRILVLPGAYPAFHFSRGVAVIGLGAAPGDVQIARVDYHVNVPPFGYETLLSNVSICGTGAADSISISGNELTHGTLTLHGVVTCGGVFLHGDAGFSLFAADSDVSPGPGDGFRGAAVGFAGGTLDVVGTRIAGWDASLADGVSAGIGLRVGAGVAVTLTGGEVTGGDGVLEDEVFGAGADGIAAGLGSSPIHLTAAGGASIRGGDGAAPGPGGDGVALTGTLAVGDAVVAGGVGTPPGVPFGLDPAVDLGYDPELSVSPATPFAGGPIAVHPGALVTATLDASLPGPAAIGFAAALDPPAAPIPTLLAGPVSLVFAYEVAFVAPDAGGALLGLQAYAQGFFVDPATGAVRTTNPVTLRMDL
jgi:hypothetical protein